MHCFAHFLLSHSAAHFLCHQLSSTRELLLLKTMNIFFVIQYMGFPSNSQKQDIKNTCLCSYKTATSYFFDSATFLLHSQLQITIYYSPIINNIISSSPPSLKLIILSHFNQRNNACKKNKSKLVTIYRPGKPFFFTSLAYKNLSTHPVIVTTPPITAMMRRIK